MAAITTKRDAKKIADILNSVMGNGHGQARQKPYNRHFGTCCLL
jgi:hypothetical protein